LIIFCYEYRNIYIYIYTSLPQENTYFTPTNIRLRYHKSRICFTYGNNFYWWKELKTYNGTSKARHIPGELYKQKVAFPYFLIYILGCDWKFACQEKHCSVYSVHSLETERRQNRINTRYSTFCNFSDKPTTQFQMFL